MDEYLVNLTTKRKRKRIKKQRHLGLESRTKTPIRQINVSRKEKWPRDNLKSDNNNTNENKENKRKENQKNCLIIYFVKYGNKVQLRLMGYTETTIIHEFLSNQNGMFSLGLIEVQDVR